MTIDHMISSLGEATLLEKYEHYKQHLESDYEIYPFLLQCEKSPDRNNLKNGQLILAHSLRWEKVYLVGLDTVAEYEAACHCIQ